MMTKTREVDELGNVYYILRNEDGTETGRAYKTCGGGYQLEPAGRDCYVPVRSVKAAVEWFDFHARIMALPPVTTWPCGCPASGHASPCVCA